LSYSVLYQDIGRKDYQKTYDLQEEIFKRLVDNKQKVGTSVPENAGNDHGTLIFVEHPHVYTLGKSGSESNLLIDFIQLQAKEAIFVKTDRGGDITYHGPGQLVGYPIFDLARLGIGLKDYIFNLEEAIIKTLNAFGIEGSRLDGATGVWIDTAKKEKTRKICAIGVKASRFITMHGFAFNINTDLTFFSYINPCGFTDKGVTSLAMELGEKQDFEEVKLLVKENLGKVFGLNWIN
jgi:lipoyl(octanoyl) transferase